MANFDISGPVGNTTNFSIDSGSQPSIMNPSGNSAFNFNTGDGTGPGTNTGSNDGSSNTTPSSSNETPSSGNTSQTQTGTSLNSISNGDLPWAIVTMPTTSAGQGGIGNNRHNLQPETWVVGFFADGDSCQQPIITGVFAGGPGAGSSYGSGSGSGGSSSDNSSSNNSSSANNSSSNNSSGGSQGDASKGEKPTGTVAQREKKAWDILTTQLGYTKEQAAGILGNLYHEGKYNVGAVGDKNLGKGNEAFGIGQWRLDRARNMRAYTNGKSDQLQAQLEFLKKELQTYPPVATAARMLNNAKNASDAARAMNYFEKFKDYTNPNAAEVKKRKNEAERIFKQYSGS